MYCTCAILETQNKLFFVTSFPQYPPHSCVTRMRAIHASKQCCRNVEKQPSDMKEHKREDQRNEPDTRHHLKPHTDPNKWEDVEAGVHQNAVVVAGFVLFKNHPIFLKKEQKQ